MSLVSALVVDQLSNARNVREQDYLVRRGTGESKSRWLKMSTAKMSTVPIRPLPSHEGK